MYWLSSSNRSHKSQASTLLTEPKASESFRKHEKSITKPTTQAHLFKTILKPTKKNHPRLLLLKRTLFLFHFCFQRQRKSFFPSDWSPKFSWAVLRSSWKRKVMGLVVVGKRSAAFLVFSMVFPWFFYWLFLEDWIFQFLFSFQKTGYQAAFTMV